MKKSIPILIILLLVFQIAFIQVSFAETKFSQELFKGLAEGENKVPQIKIPNYKRIKLNNGMVIYLVKDDKLPIVEMTGYIKGGRKQESRQLAGISDFMFKMMNTGTKNLSEQDFSRYKEAHGVDLNFNVKRDYFKFSGDVLSTDREHLISLTADIFKNPDFEAEYFKRIKQETLRSLSQAKTREKSLLDMYFYKNIYNKHPYSFADNLDLRIAALNSMNSDKLNKFYNNNIAPNNIMIGIAGNIDLKNMENLVRKYFARWPRKGTKIKNPEIKVKKADYNRIILVNKPDATQAKIKLGYNFFDNQFKKRVAFKMANRVYGSGGFGSRLMKNLRSEKGYVYGVHSGVKHNEVGGEYYITTEVKPEKSYQTIEAIKEEMLAIKEGSKKIKETELFKVINLYNAFLPKIYKTKLSVLSEVIYNVEIRDRNPGYINKFISKYNNLNVKEAQEVFEEYTYPEDFLTVIVGKKEDILPQFNKKGIEVKVVEVK